MNICLPSRNSNKKNLSLLFSRNLIFVTRSDQFGAPDVLKQGFIDVQDFLTISRWPCLKYSCDKIWIGESVAKTLSD